MNFNGSMYEMKPLDPKQKKRLKSIAVMVIIIIFFVALIFSSVYTVTEQEQAVITTFGKYSKTEGAGIRFKLPFGIQEANFVDTTVRREEIGYRTENNGTTVREPKESKMITGDMNIVNVDFFLTFRVSDPRLYLYASQNPVAILRNIAQSRIRDVVSSYKVDEVLTIGKAEIQSRIKNLIIEELETYSIGLTLIDIQMQDCEPPNEDVIAAFRSVEAAEQEGKAEQQRALEYQNQNIPTARAEADKLIRNADLVKQDRINEAIRQVEMFNAMFEQYDLNPNIHRSRMYFEAIEQALPGVKLIINTGGNDNVSMIYPLDSFNNNND